MIKNILVGYSGARGAQVAFRQAVDLARAMQARLHLAYVEPLPREDAQVTTRLGDVPADAFRAALADTVPEAPEDPSTPSDVLDAIGEQCREEGIHCSFHHLHGDAGERLAQLARTAGLVALGKHDEAPSAGALPLGRVARQMATRLPVPVLFAAREYEPLDGVTVVYEPTAPGGRTLNLAAEIAFRGNLTLNVMALGDGPTEPAEAAAEARAALKAYHLEGEFLPAARRPAPPVSGAPDPLQAAALTWNDPLLVVPAPAKRWLSRPLESLRFVLSQANTNVLVVP
jgi:nucleotide-binding universal stress UspA family protein